ncbi:alkaline phosphatase family protein [Nonomuraea sp. CA-218870]|uniref:alkaline phosphatase family protein n=1 Tax=Nonomuraea sp. CA-218870 TaxID=3239998 RepID=UPI003D89E04A
MTEAGTLARPGLDLRAVPGLVLSELGRGGRGVLVLAVDGLSWQVARRVWRSAELTCLTSTFPSTSASAWMTSVTGAPVSDHLVVGAAYRERAGGPLVDVITGDVLAGEPAPRGPVVRLPTIFERAEGADPMVVGRELDLLSGPWVDALTRGAARRPAREALTRDPHGLVAGVAADVEAAIGVRRTRPLLLWVYVNLDDHLHRHGYDERAVDALAELERHATAWAARGWRVLAHADHGLVPVASDPVLARRWERVDAPGLCELPGGGAGRVRWLYPRAGRENEVAERLAEALDGHARVLPASALGELGLMEVAGPVRERLGAVVAIATSPRFPLPDPGLSYEHGALSDEETLVPLARWVRSSRA